MKKMMFVMIGIFLCQVRIAWADSLDARIISVEGDVTVFYHDRANEGVPAAEGMPLEAGDRVQTGVESRAELGLDANSVIDLDPDSNLTITSTERKASAFDLGLGSLMAKIKSGLFGANGSMEVRTPFAVAAVRGTEFAVENSADKGANIGVFDEGRVAVRSPNATGEVFLEHNQETSVLKGQAPVAPKSLEHFAARREMMAKVRNRAANLRRRWKPMSRAQRAGTRKRLYNKKRKLIRDVRERRRTIRQQRPQRQIRQRR